MPIKISNKRYEEIKRIVVKMFVEYGITCVPISGFEIAHKMGIRIIPYSAIAAGERWLLLKKSEDGFSIERTNGQWYIYYNDTKDYGRVNNTIMHEIGHIVLDHTEDSELAEKEVKFFAKFALAPPVLIHKLKLNNPKSISEIFEISKEAARYAYKYYLKWRSRYHGSYTDYEYRLLCLFNQLSLGDGIYVSI